MPGRVGFVSRSGTLVYQIVHELTQRGIGQSTCVGMGGDPVHGIGFIEALAMFEADPETDLMIMTGEIGGDDEERAAAYITEHVTKPVVAYIAGFEAPPGKRMGHAGAIVTGSKGTAAAKAEALEAGGVRVARTPSQVAELVEVAWHDLDRGRPPTGGLVRPRPARRCAGGRAQGDGRGPRRRGPRPGASLARQRGRRGLAVATQLRVGWLYTMAGHAVAITATGSGGAVDGLGVGVVGVRLGMLTIAAVAVAMLVVAARAPARRVHDVGVRRGRGRRIDRRAVRRS